MFCTHPPRYDYNVNSVAALVLTGVGAFCVNWSGVWVLQACSPLTLTLTGPLKFASTLWLSFLLGLYYPGPRCLLFALGSIVAMAG
jgi:hypothetical protein